MDTFEEKWLSPFGAPYNNYFFLRGTLTIQLQNSTVAQYILIYSVFRPNKISNYHPFSYILRTDMQELRRESTSTSRRPPSSTSGILASTHAHDSRGGLTRVHPRLARIYSSWWRSYGMRENCLRLTERTGHENTGGEMRWNEMRVRVVREMATKRANANGPGISKYMVPHRPCA